MADRQVRVDLVARDRASPVIEDVADAAGDLEQLTPEIEIGADTSAAETAIADVAEAAERAAREDREIVIRARIDDLKGELRTLQTELDQTGEKADQTARQLDRVDGPGAGGGAGLRGNAIADLTGPLGEASGAASDFAGVFDGLGDIVEDVATRMGSSTAMAGRLSGAMGLAGVAVAGGAALWSMFTASQARAREQAEKMLKTQQDLNEALSEGDTSAAAEALIANYSEAIGYAEAFGYSLQDITRYITGQTDALTGLDTKAAEALASGEYNARAQADAIRAARDEYIDLNGTLDDQKGRLDDVAGAMGGLVTSTDDVTIALGNADSAMLGVKRATDQAATAAANLDAKWNALKGRVDDDQAWLNLQDTFDATQLAAEEAWTAAANGAADTEAKVRDADQATNDLKLQVIDYAAQVLGLPPSRVTEILADLDAGSVVEVERTLADLTKTRDAVIRVITTGIGIGTGRGAGGLVTGASAPAAVNVTQVFPRGWRASSTITEARTAARRSGGLYQRSQR